jgi:hypothetical protein
MARPWQRNHRPELGKRLALIRLNEKAPKNACSPAAYSITLT